MGHSWDSWGQKMVTNLHKQQQRIRRNALNLLIKFVNVCCQLNILRVLKTGRRGSVSWVRIPPPPPFAFATTLLRRNVKPQSRQNVSVGGYEVGIFSVDKGESICTTCILFKARLTAIAIT